MLSPEFLETLRIIREGRGRYSRYGYPFVLRTLTNTIFVINEKYDLNINAKKTKFMIISKNHNREFNGDHVHNTES